MGCLECSQIFALEAQKIMDLKELGISSKSTPRLFNKFAYIIEDTVQDLPSRW